jgi:hypothetical protein
MNRKARIAQQRVLVQEAIGKLRAASELFGIEEGDLSGSYADYHNWDDAIDKFEKYVFDESPLA